MPLKGSSNNQFVPLPKGGGTINGLGEKFTPDLFTGTGNLTTPILLPSGRNGYQPQLNLSYSTGNGNGPFGLGWRLNIPAIDRKTSKGIPVYDNHKDVFILSGYEDLVPVSSDSETVVSYRPRTEGLFAKIEHHVDGNNDFWHIKLKDGSTSIYGNMNRKNLRDVKNDDAVIADPDNYLDIFSWKLTSTTDSLGNTVQYTYESDNPDDSGPHHWDQSYLKEIGYIEYTRDSKKEFLIKVRLVYDHSDGEYNIRPDLFFNCKAGFEVRTVRRCSRIDVLLNDGNEVDEVLTRSYQFNYAVTLYNELSVLKSIKVTGSSPDKESLEMPPLEFDYTCFDPTNRRLIKVTGPDLPGVSTAQKDFYFIDINGNGLPDIVEMGDQYRYWLNLGDGKFDYARSMKCIPSKYRLSDNGVQLLDADGDGRVEMVVSDYRVSGYFKLQHDLEWDAGEFYSLKHPPGFNLEDPEVKLLDLDGDGVTDAIKNSTQLICYFNDPKQGWYKERRLGKKGLDVFPDVSFSDSRVKLGDMSGDGLQDIVLITGRTVEYWPNRGYGNWGRKITMANPPVLPFNYNPEHVLLGDVNGDGIADITYIGDNHVDIWINSSGNSWNEPIRVNGTPDMTCMDTVRLIDLLGNGTSGVLWSSSGFSGAPKMFFLDLAGGQKPYLLNSINNGLGAETHIGYASSSKFYVEDMKSSCTKWETTLPFPVHVVEKIETVDVFSRNRITTGYRYRHGCWDGVEREFRGFGMTEHMDSEESEDYCEAIRYDMRMNAVGKGSFSPPLLTRTWFHLGPVGTETDWKINDFSKEYWETDKPLSDSKEALENIQGGRRIQRDAARTLRGSLIRTELFSKDGSPLQKNPYSVLENSYTIREISVPDNDKGLQKSIFFPYLCCKRETQWERGDDPLTKYTISGMYDDFGQQLSYTEVYPPRRSARCTAVKAFGGEVQPDERNYLAVHTFTQYAEPEDTENYMMDRVYQTGTASLINPPAAYESEPDDPGMVQKDWFDTCIKLHKQLSEAVEEWLDERNPSPSFRILSHTVNHFDGSAFEGKIDRKTDKYGVITRSESLVYTDELLEDGYRKGRRPVYLGGTASLPRDVPELKAEDLGYHRINQTKGYFDGYYVNTICKEYDFQKSPAEESFGLVTAIKDSLGHTNTISCFDTYKLFPTITEDPMGFITVVKHDYQAMKPLSITNENDIETHYRYNSLGHLCKQFICKRTENGKYEGGSEEKPDIQYIYDFRAYDRTGMDENPQPVSVTTLQRIWHGADNINDDMIKSVEYSDGFGRLIQKRLQGEEQVHDSFVKDRVIVSGWQNYDNKGQVIEKFEAFYDSGFDFKPEEDSKKGVSVKTAYDPRGNAIHILFPDGSQQRVIYGIPYQVTNPGTYLPTPWEACTYDANDLASYPFDPDASRNTGNSSIPALTADENHYFTPARVRYDAMGRTICKLTQNGQIPDSDTYISCSDFDMNGNLIRVKDQLGREAFTYTYDLMKRAMSVSNLDSGFQTTVLNSEGNPVEVRDDKGKIVYKEYDALNRPLSTWARNNGNDGFRLVERQEYGNDMSDSVLKAANRVGKLYKYFDGAGMECYPVYDIRGNMTEKTRRVISDKEIQNGWSCNWLDKDENSFLLDEYKMSYSFDAINRPVKIQYPWDVTGKRPEVVPKYNHAGYMESIRFDGEDIIKYISYNAKGQRTFISYGNNIMTHYSYDPFNFRLTGMKSEACRQQTTPYEWEATGGALQDYTYVYDPVGNIVSIEDATQGCGTSTKDRDKLIRLFKYDALYRLVEATGRTCRDHNSKKPFEDVPCCGSYKGSSGDPLPDRQNAPDLTDRYRENYSYDPAGNLLMLDFTNLDNINTNFTREYGFAGEKPGEWQQAKNNMLSSYTQGSDTYSYTYDENGNLAAQNLERFFEWDYAGHMTGFQIKTQNAVSVDVGYFYSPDGIRIKKFVRKNGIFQSSTVYVDGVFEHYKWEANGIKENNSLHVMESKIRIATIKRGDIDLDDAGPDMCYFLPDHLGSCSLTIDGTGGWINREEYTPYGETSFGSYAKKKYRYAGKEKDGESGLYYFGARYFAPWLCRWTSCDPAGAVDGLDLYIYALNNPVKYTDIFGHEAALKISNQPSFNMADFFRQTFQAANDNKVATAGATGAGLSVPMVLGALISGAVFGVGLYGVYMLGESKVQNWEAEARTDRQNAYVRQRVEESWKNGFITDAEYDLYRATGTLVLQEKENCLTPETKPNDSSNAFSKYAQKMFTSRFCDIPELKRLWDIASKGLPITSEGYNTARGNFWDMINNSLSQDAITVRKALREAGYELQGGNRAPLLNMKCWDNRRTREITDRRLSIDHIAAQSKYRHLSLDSCNLRFTTQRDNSFRGVGVIDQ